MKFEIIFHDTKREQTDSEFEQIWKTIVKDIAPTTTRIEQQAI